MLKLSLMHPVMIISKNMITTEGFEKLPKNVSTVTQLKISNMRVAKRKVTEGFVFSNTKLTITNETTTTTTYVSISPKVLKIFKKAHAQTTPPLIIEMDINRDQAGKCKGNYL